jgi:predicted DNA-binding protein with PD1-like motif
MRKKGLKSAAAAWPKSSAMAMKKVTSMKTQVLNDQGEKTYALIFDRGDEFKSLLTEFAKSAGLGASRFTAVGAFERATLGYFDWEKKDYIKLPIDEQVEVLALTGDIALYEGEPQVHAHVVVGQRDGTTRGGHVLEAFVRPTLEVILDEAPAHLQKRHDPESGLALIDM